MMNGRVRHIVIGDNLNEGIDNGIERYPTTLIQTQGLVGPLDVRRSKLIMEYERAGNTTNPSASATTPLGC